MNQIKKIFDNLNGVKSNRKIKISELLKFFERKSFGALLILPCILLLIPPIGAIPGAPFLLGLIIAVITFQLILGIYQPWVPKKLLNMKINGNKLSGGIHLIRPILNFLGGFTKKRLAWLTYPPFINVFASAAFIFSLMIMFIGFIPFLPDVLSIAILFLGIGLITSDGLIVVIGFTLTLLMSFGMYAFFFPF